MFTAGRSFRMGFRCHSFSSPSSDSAYSIFHGTAAQKTKANAAPAPNKAAVPTAPDRNGAAAPVKVAAGTLLLVLEPPLLLEVGHAATP